VHGISLAADCTAVILLGLVTWLIPTVLLIIPMVLHMLINGCIVCLDFTRPRDHVDDQSLGRSSVLFLGSRVMSHDVLEAWKSRDGSCD
jgi:hypothetical protein